LDGIGRARVAVVAVSGRVDRARARLTRRNRGVAQLAAVGLEYAVAAGRETVGVGGRIGAGRAAAVGARQARLDRRVHALREAVGAGDGVGRAKVVVVAVGGRVGGALARATRDGGVALLAGLDHAVAAGDRAI